MFIIRSKSNIIFNNEEVCDCLKGKADQKERSTIESIRWLRKAQREESKTQQKTKSWGKEKIQNR